MLNLSLDMLKGYGTFSAAAAASVADLVTAMVTSLQRESPLFHTRTCGEKDERAFQQAPVPVSPVSPQVQPWSWVGIARRAAHRLHLAALLQAHRIDNHLQRLRGSGWYPVPAKHNLQHTEEGTHLFSEPAGQDGRAPRAPSTGRSAHQTAPHSTWRTEAARACSCRKLSSSPSLAKEDTSCTTRSLSWPRIM